MISELLAPVLDFMPTGSIQLTVVLVLLVAVLYTRRLMNAGSLLADWVSRVAFSMIVLIVLLLTGIVPGLDVAAAQRWMARLVDGAMRIVEVVL